MWEATVDVDLRVGEVSGSVAGALFAMLPVIFAVAVLPGEVGRLGLLENYDPKELILFCITVEGVALLGALEVLVKRKPVRKRALNGCA